MTTVQRARANSLYALEFGDGEADLIFENSGRRPLLVPGFGHAVAIERKPDQRFAHGFHDWAQNRLTAREIAMLRLMNEITDRPHWDIDIFDDASVSQLAKEASATPLISPPTWNWCLAELRDKAVAFQSTKFIHVYDSASGICKSDALIPASLLQDLGSGVEELARRSSSSSSLPTQRDEQISGLVDPSLFPLVYGRTRVLSDGGTVGLENVVEAVDQGTLAPKQHWERHTLERRRGSRRRFGRDWEHSWEPRADRFSSQFQWLPCEVEFQKPEPKDGIRVGISSYINNLNPKFHRSVYTAIEKIVALSIKPWNDVLTYRNRGRVPERIRTYGVRWEPPYPQWAVNLDDLPKNKHDSTYDEAYQRVLAYAQEPENPRAPPPGRWSPQIRPDWETTLGLNQTVALKYQRIKHWLHPEPGISFTYGEWKEGKNNFAVVPGQTPDRKGVLPPKEDHEFYTISLQDTFQERGLQVVVEIGSIELTPEQPTCAETEWVLSGTLNEHIVATTIIYFSSTNLTPDSASVSFRVEADLDPSAHVYGPETGSRPYHAFEPLADIYGVVPASELGENYDGVGGGKAVQELGTVLTPDGRLIAFPNVLQHRTGACALLDPTKPGRKMFLRLHLVDPHYRICSTRNVPPQRHDWWLDAGAGRIDWKSRGVPQEVVDRIADEIGEWPMGMEEARSLRGRFLNEQQSIHERIREGVHIYQFGRWASVGSAWP